MVMKTMPERIKTDVRMSPKVMKQVDEMAQQLGIPKNAFITVSVCRMLTEMAPFVKGHKKRSTLLSNVELVFQKVMGVAKKAA